MDQRDRSAGILGGRWFALRVLAALTLAIFVVEGGIMLLFFQGQTVRYDFVDACWDAALLVAIVFPLLYFLAYRPLLRDHQERRRAEEALRESERLLAGIVERAPAFVCVLRGPQHVFALANEKYFELVGRRDLVGKALLDALPELANSPFPGILDRVYRTGEALEARDVPVVLARGRGGRLEERWVDFVYLPQRDPNGAVSGILVHGVDLTARKRAEEELRTADRRKDEFLAMLSHELRNPLAPIHSCLHILDRCAPGSEQAVHARAVIGRQVEQMTRLVGDLLDVTRIAHAKIHLRRERLDLCEVVGRTADDARSSFTTRNIELGIDRPPAPMWVDGDGTRLAQAFGNLLHNAAKFTPEGGRVFVTLEQEGEAAVLRVSDTGVGIAPDLLPHLFQPFTQADRSLDRSGGGLGLGLSLVKSLIELHGGEVQARSDGLGRGAEFTLRLPLATEPAPAVESPSEAKAAASVPARRVLVIEDNADAATSLKDVLELDGHEVALALTGPEGLATARSFAPDLVLCDIGLPAMDGYEVAKAFRADRALQDIPLVALTGYATAEDQKKSAAAGFDRHLAKPVDIGTLGRILADLPRHDGGGERHDTSGGRI